MNKTNNARGHLKKKSEISTKELKRENLQKLDQEPCLWITPEGE